MSPRYKSLVVSLGLMTALQSGLIQACDPYVGPVPDADELRYPVGLAVHPSGRWLYVLGTNFDATYRVEDGGTVQVIDTDTMTIVPDATVRVASFGGRLALGGDPSAPDTLWAATRGDDSIVGIDVLNDGAMLSCGGSSDTRDCRVSDLPADPYDLREVYRAPDTDLRTVAVASLSGAVSVIDVAGSPGDSPNVRSRAIVAGANNVEPYDDDSLLVSGRFSTSVVHVGWARGQDGLIASIVPLRTLTIPVPGRTTEIRDIAVSTDRARAYFSSASPAGIDVFDITADTDGDIRGRYVGRWDLDDAPADMVLVSEAGRDVLYVALADADVVVAIDPATGVVESRIPVGALPFGLAVDRVNRQRLYVSLFDAHSVAAIDINPASASWRRVVARTPSASEAR